MKTKLTILVSMFLALFIGVRTNVFAQTNLPYTKNISGSYDMPYSWVKAGANPNAWASGQPPMGERFSDAVSLENNQGYSIKATGTTGVNASMDAVLTTEKFTTKGKKNLIFIFYLKEADTDPLILTLKATKTGSTDANENIWISTNPQSVLLGGATIIQSSTNHSSWKKYIITFPNSYDNKDAISFTFHATAPLVSTNGPGSCYINGFSISADFMPKSLPYFEDFESFTVLDDGWKITKVQTYSSWQRTSTISYDAPYTYSLQCPPSTANQNEIAETPLLNTGIERQALKLSFVLYLPKASAPNKATELKVQGSIDGGLTYEYLWLYSKDSANEDVVKTSQATSNSAWEKITLSLPEKYQNKIVRFAFTVTTDATLGNGVQIDKLSLDGAATQGYTDLSISSLTQPDPASAYLAEETVALKIKNNAADPISTGTQIQLSYQLNNLNAVTETLILSSDLAPDAELEYTFAKKVKIGSLGSTLSLIAKLPSGKSDINTKNDTLVQPIYNLLAILPFSQNLGSNTLLPYTLIDNNNDGKKWSPANNYSAGISNYVWSYNPSNTNTASDDYLFTPAFSFKKDTTYELTFEPLTWGTDSNNLAVFWATDKTISAINSTPLLDYTQVKQSNIGVKKLRIVPTQDGIYYFVFHLKNGVRTDNRKGVLYLKTMAINSVPDNEVSMDALVSPVSDFLSSTTVIKVRVKNNGINPIQTLEFAYKIDANIPVIETANNLNILGNETYEYTFTTPADLSGNGQTYQLKTWVKMTADTKASNDTLCPNITNTFIQNLPLVEKFEATTLPANWKANNPSGSLWTPSTSVAVLFSNIDGSSTRSMYNAAATNATLYTPYISTKTKSNISISFYVYMPLISDAWLYQTNLSLRIYTNESDYDSVWNYVDGPNTALNITASATPTSEPTWEKFTINLPAAYENKIVKFCFAGIKNNTNVPVAIDNLIIDGLAPSGNEDLELLSITAPQNKASYDLEQVISVNLKNNSKDLLSKGSIIKLNYMFGHTTNIKEELILTEDLLSGAELLYTFKQKAEFPVNKETIISVIAQLPSSDINLANDTLTKYCYNQRVELPYIINYGTSTPAAAVLKPWTVIDANADGSYGYGLWVVASQSIATTNKKEWAYSNNNNMASDDYLFTPGVYMQTGKTYSLNFDPITWQTSGSNTDSNSLIVYVSNGNTVEALLSQNILFEAQIKQINPNVQAVRFIPNYDGIYNFAFHINNPARQTNRSGTLYLKDISIKEILSQDVGVEALLSPNPGILTNSEKVKIRVKNTGIDPIADLSFSYQINGGEIITESQTTLNLATAQTFEYEFTALADLSANKSHTIKIWTSLKNDALASNDTLSRAILNTLALPPYRPVFTGPNNEASYWTIVDSNTDSKTWSVAPSQFFKDNSDDNTTGWKLAVPSKANLAKDYLYSRPIRLEAEKIYELNYVAASQYEHQHLVDVYLSVKREESFDSIAQIALDTIKKAGWFAKTKAELRKKYTFTVEKDSIYYLSFYAHTLGVQNSSDLYITDIEVLKITSVDLQVSNLEIPAMSCIEVSPTMTITNKGLLPVSAFDITYQIDDNEIRTIAYTGNPIDLNESILYTLPAINATSVGAHKLRAWLEIEEDSDPANDTVSGIIQKLAPQNIPYNYSFNNIENNMLWYPKTYTTEANASNWNLNNTLASATFTPTYNANDWLISPCFEFEASKIYKIQYDLMATGVGNAHLQVRAGNIPQDSGSFDILLSNNIKVGNPSKEIAMIQVPQNGIYNLAFLALTNGGAGIEIKNISIAEAGIIDLELIAITAPAISANLALPQAIGFTLKNKGSDTISDLRVFYQVNENPIVDAIISGAIAPNTDKDYEFLQKFDFSTLGIYDLKVWTSIPYDHDHSNDTLHKTILSKKELSLLTLETPVDGQLTATETITVKVKNTGSFPLSKVALAYTIDAGTAVWDTLAEIAVNETLDFIFAQQLNLLAPSTYALNIFAEFSTDTIKQNIVSRIPDTLDAGVTTFIAPLNGQLSVAETITVKVKNFGNKTLNNLRLYYKVDQSPNVIDSIPSLSAGSEIEFSFKTKADFSVEKSYNLQVSTLLGGDVNFLNDGIVSIIICKKTPVIDTLLPPHTFAARLESKNSAQLAWSKPAIVLGNINTLKGYRIYRNGSEYKNIEDINASIFLDTSLAPNTYCYAIAAIYDKGISQKADSVCVTVIPIPIEEIGTFSCKLYPNPAVDKLYIEASVPVQKVEIFNILGQSQLRLQGIQASKMDIDISTLSKGTYIINVHSKEGFVQNKCIIK